MFTLLAVDDCAVFPLLRLTDVPPIYADAFTGFDAPPKYAVIATAALSPEIVPELRASP
jgi:hypothetical protein